jgi:hypothetical protein
MASIKAITATPTTVPTGGGKATITVEIDNPDKVATLIFTLDGSSGSIRIPMHEGLTFSVDPADTDKPGYVVASVDAGGRLAVAPDGVSFVFTAT